MMIITSGAASSAWQASAAGADSNATALASHMRSLTPAYPPRCQSIRAQRTRRYDTAHGHRTNEPAPSRGVPIVAAIV
jgi:hypothetical protein